MYELPIVEENEASDLIIIRDKSFIASGAAMIISIDQIAAYSLPSGSYILRKVSPGAHVIAAASQSPNSPSPIPTKEKMAHITTKAGEKVYLLVEPVGIYFHEGKISQISDAQGRELMAESDFLPD
jgi:hypothetical protein